MCSSEDRKDRREAADKQPKQKCDDDETDCPLKPSVKIAADCRLIAKGKTRKYKAEGTPKGGNYKWSATGKVSIVSGGSAQTVEVKGDSLSAAMDDSELKVEYIHAGQTATDSVKLTVYELSKIEAKLRGTPCKRTGTRANTMPAKSSTKDSKTFDATAITITRECGELKLEATVKPAGVPISWTVERASDDAGGLSGTPTHAADGGDTKRKVSADATGSFHIIAFVDCNGTGTRDPEEGAIILNVNIVNVEVMSGAANNKIVKRTTRFTDSRSNAAVLIVDSSSTAGAVPAVNASYTDAEFTKYPLSMKVTVKLTGGGADNRRGTDKVRLGYIQTTTADSVRGTYTDGRTEKEVITASAGGANPITSGAPAMLAFPVRDTRGANNSASGPFIISSSDVDKANLASGGLRRIVRYVEPPAIVLHKKHPVTSTNLNAISGSNDFDVFLSAYSKDFDENYIVVASASWSITYGSYTNAGGWKKTGAAVTAGSAMTTHSPPKRAEDLDVERCPPNFVDNIKLDAR